MLKNKELFTSKKFRLAIAAALGAGIVACSFGGKMIARADTSLTNTQVTVNYYAGIPAQPKTYDESYIDGDANVEKVTYTTKSIGRLQWGEAGVDGTFDVYYDAADIHRMAAALNDSEALYIETYRKYLEARSAVLE